MEVGAVLGPRAQRISQEKQGPVSQGRAGALCLLLHASCPGMHTPRLLADPPRAPTHTIGWPLQTSSTRRSTLAASCWAWWARLHTQPSVMQRARPPDRLLSMSVIRRPACHCCESQPAGKAAARWAELTAAVHNGSRLEVPPPPAVQAPGGSALLPASKIIFCRLQCCPANAVDLC